MDSDASPYLLWYSCSARSTRLASSASNAARSLGVAANFAADGAFTGSSLTGWRPVGGATWRAENGEIIATPGATGGWLLADKPFEDVSMVASFRCTGACTTGLLVRAEPTADGGTKGILVSVTAEERALYRVTLDAQGRETSRDRLRPPAPGQLRVAPPAPATPPAPPPAAAAVGPVVRRRCPAASRHRSRGPRTPSRPASGTPSKWRSTPTSCAPS